METADDLSGLTFEQALQELESIVQALERDDQPLEEALRLFRRGQALVQYCNRLLQEAELQVQQVVGEGLAPWTDTEDEA